MLTLRPARWPQDVAALSELDTSFVTDRIYRPVLDGFTFHLDETAIAPPLRKQYEFRLDDPEERQNWDYIVIGEEGGQIAGIAAAQYAAWNRRVIIHHLYVTPAFRGQRIGTKLLDSLDAFARAAAARCLWLETQNINYPAIQFYLRSGFRFCGFDESLYPPEDLEQEEIALYFIRPVPPAEGVYQRRR